MKKEQAPKFEDTMDLEEKAVPSFEDTIEVDDTEEENKASSAESARRAALQGVTLGFADEIGGAIYGAIDKIQDPRGVNFNESRKRFTDVLREEDKKTAKDHPYISGAAELAGGIATGGGLVLGAGKALGKKLSTKGLLALAGTEGAATGLGKSENKSLKDAAIGAAAGTAGAGLGAGLGVALGKGAKKAANLVKDSEKLTESLYKTLGKKALNFDDKVTNRIVRNAEKFGAEYPSGKPIEAVEFALANDIITKGASLKKITKSAQEFADKGTQHIENTVNTFDELYKEPLPIKDALNDMFDNATSKFKLPSGQALKTRSRELKVLDNLRHDIVGKFGESTDLRAMVEAKRFIGRELKKAKGSDFEKGQIAVLESMYNSVNDGIGKIMKDVDPGLHAAFKEGNKVTHLAITLQEGARRAKDTAGFVQSIKDSVKRGGAVGIAGSFFGMSGLGALVGAGSIATDLVKRHGASYGAVTFKKIHEGLAKGSLKKDMGKYSAQLMKAYEGGGKTLVREHLKLLNTSPEYRSMFGTEEEER